MKLTTKCPKCSTVFDVSLDTLQQRKGYTRCISCAYIFDGFEEVLPDDSASHRLDSGLDKTDTEQSQTIAQSEHKASIYKPTSIQESGFIDSKTEQSPAVEQKPVNNSLQATHSISTPRFAAPSEDDFVIHDKSVPASKPTDTSHKISDLDHALSNETENDFVISFSESLSPEEKHLIKHASDYTASHSDDYDYDDEYVGISSKIMSAVWVCLIAIGVAVFLLQAVYVFRVQIAQNFPDTRPRLEALCEKFACDMPWTRKPEHIVVVHSSLQSQMPSTEPDAEPDNNQENNTNNNTETSPELGDTTDYILQVVLRNTYEMDQEWPNLVLELTDAAGAKIARKNIAAQQYLVSEYTNKPFGANSEYHVQLPIKLQGLKVNGYQVTTFFP